jgi:hypothetical protein
MSFETISLLLNWLQLGVLLVIMFRLAHTFDLIANTQRELRRAIHHLGERRAAEPSFDDASHNIPVLARSCGERAADVLFEPAEAAPENLAVEPIP